MKFYLNRYKKLVCVGISCFIFGFILSSWITKLQNITKHNSIQEYDIIVLILSSPKNFRQRNSIRKTWLQLNNNVLYDSFGTTLEYMDIPKYSTQGFLHKDSIKVQEKRLKQYKSKIQNNIPMRRPNVGIERKTFSIKHFFCVGILDLPSDTVSDLILENVRHNDILMLPSFEDSYEQLTQKIISSFSAIIKNYNFKYLLKSDDDSYIQLNNVIEELEAYDTNLSLNFKDYNIPPELYWGYFNGAAKVKYAGPWAEKEWFLCDRYLPYALGGGYVLSFNLVKYIAENANILSKYRSEDVSVGMWLAPLRIVYRRHDPRFNTEWKPRNFSPLHIVLHKVSPEAMEQLWAQSKTPIIENQSTENIGYFYNWDHQPSKCCLSANHV